MVWPLRSEPLRGRVEPMGQALAVLRSAHQSGSTAAVLVSGPPGIGKTALLSEIRAQATAMGFRAAACKCDQIEQVWPGAPVIAMLRGGPAPLVSAAEYEKITRLVSEPLLLADQIASSLENAALAGPLLIAIDDFQWSDRVTRFALRTLIPRLIGLPVVWVLASRADDFGLDLDQIRAETVRLAPLPAADIMVIVQDRLGRPLDERTRRFAETADGNPFLAIQIIDCVARSAERGDPGAVPGEFTAAVAQRAAELTGAAREVLNVAAVAGRPWPVREIAGMMPGGGDPGRERAVAEAVGAGLITASGGIVSFRHDLVREAVYAGIPRGLVSQLHRAFATYYLTVAGDPLMAASHARQAATPGDAGAAEILLDAAEKLVGSSAGDAGGLAALAFRTVEPAQPEWLPLSLRCLSVLCRAQHAAEAIAVADMILARVDDADTIGKVETDAARALWLGGRISELLARTEIALKITGLDAAVIARLRAVRALARTRLPDAGTAGETAAALKSARATGDREALELALQAAGEAAANDADHRAALARFRELRTLRGMPCLAEEITALQFLDRHGHAQVLLDQARADSRAATETMLPALAYAQAWQDFTLGRLDDADSGARALIELGNQLGSSLYILDAVIVRVSVALLRGDIDTAANQVRHAEELGGADDTVRKPGLAVMRGWIAAARGDVQQAVVALRPVVDGASQSHGFWPVWPCWNGLFFEFARMAGRPGLHRRLRRHCRDRRSPQPRRRQFRRPRPEPARPNQQRPGPHRAVRGRSCPEPPPDTSRIRSGHLRPCAARRRRAAGRAGPARSRLGHLPSDRRGDLPRGNPARDARSRSSPRQVVYLRKTARDGLAGTDPGRTSSGRSYRLWPHQQVSRHRTRRLRQHHQYAPARRLHQTRHPIPGAAGARTSRS